VLPTSLAIELPGHKSKSYVGQAVLVLEISMVFDFAIEITQPITASPNIFEHEDEQRIAHAKHPHLCYITACEQLLSAVPFAL